MVSGAWRGDQPVYQHDWDDWIDSDLYRYFFLSFDGQEWTIAENTEAGAVALARGDYPTFLSNANGAEARPCLTDGDCKGATRCVQNACIPIGTIFRVPGPQIELQVIGPAPTTPACRTTRTTVDRVANELFELFESSGLAVLMRPSTDRALEGTHAIEQLD